MVIGIENNKQEKWRQIYEQQRNRTFLGIQLIFTYLTCIFNTRVEDIKKKTSMQEINIENVCTSFWYSSTYFDFNLEIRLYRLL